MSPLPLLELNVPRQATWSLSGPPAATRDSTVPSWPSVTEASALGVKLGRLVITLMTPRLVFLPCSVPCGPRVTSTDSTSVKS